MDSRVYLVAMVLAGVLIGSIAAFNTADQTSNCKQLESQLEQSKNFTGSIACFPPGVLEINESEEVQNRTESYCTCRNTINDTTRLFNIRVAR